MFKINAFAKKIDEGQFNCPYSVSTPFEKGWNDGLQEVRDDLLVFKKKKPHDISWASDVRDYITHLGTRKYVILEEIEGDDGTLEFSGAYVDGRQAVYRFLEIEFCSFHSGKYEMKPSATRAEVTERASRNGKPETGNGSGK